MNDLFDTLDEDLIVDMFMGEPKTGKTTIIGSYPKPLLLLSVGKDGGQIVLKGIEGISVKKFENDAFTVSNGTITLEKTSADKLCSFLIMLRKQKGLEFKTIVCDTIGAIQEDEITAIEVRKGGKKISTPELGLVARVMENTKEVMKTTARFFNARLVWLTHTKFLACNESTTLKKTVRIIPNLTENNGKKFLREATNVFYTACKNVKNLDGSVTPRFLTFVGVHPLMSTGTREIRLSLGGYISDFTYEKWSKAKETGELEFEEIEEALFEVDPSEIKRGEQGEK